MQTKNVVFSQTTYENEMGSCEKVRGGRSETCELVDPCGSGSTTEEGSLLWEDGARGKRGRIATRKIIFKVIREGKGMR